MEEEKKKRSARSNQKLKLLYLYDILKKETDEDHGITMAEIIKKLEALNVTAERKSIGDDLKQLETLNIEVILEKTDKKSVYKLVTRDFELAEVKLLVDLIQSSKFVTQKKTNELVKKLEGLVSVHEASSLQRQVYVEGRNKADNEKIYYNVDNIHKAINSNKKIEFTYFSWVFKKDRKEKEYRHDSKVYQVSPVALIWTDENYYLVAYDPEEDKTKHYRVDKMDAIKVTDKKRDTKATLKKYNAAEYLKKRYNMFDGVETDVEFKCSNKMVNVLVDRFGRDVRMYRLDEEHVKVTVAMSVNDHFLGWVLALGDGVELIGSELALEKMKDFVNRAYKKYE